MLLDKIAFIKKLTVGKATYLGMNSWNSTVNNGNGMMRHFLNNDIAYWKLKIKVSLVINDFIITKVKVMPPPQSQLVQEKSRRKSTSRGVVSN